MPPSNKSLADKLARAKLESPTACWPWPGKRNKLGYGIVHVATVGGKRKTKLAHRVALELVIGELRAEAVILHTCDNPPCVNPAHLRLGTHADNVADAKSKGRLFHQKKTHCVKGHPLTRGNLYVQKQNPDFRVCATCARAAQARRRAK